MCRRTSRKLGLSLLELTLATALLALLVGLLVQIMLVGLRYYRKSALTVELQQACLLAGNQIAQDIRQTTLGAIQEDTSAAKEFLVMASPRDSSGTLRFSAENVLLWQSFVGYYVGQPRDKTCLMRQVSPITPVAVVPSVPASMNAAFFRGLGSPRVIAEGIYSIDVIRGRETTLRLGAQNLGFGLRVTVETRIVARN